MIANGSRFRWMPPAAIAAMAWLALFPIASVDAYYHLAIGKRILEDGKIPARGVGSATFGSAPWHDNEWGFQVLAAALGRSERDENGVLELTPAGRAALIGLRALCLAATLALLSRAMARAGVDPLSRAIGVVLAAFLTFGNLFWDVRPQILTYLAFVAVLALLEEDRTGSRWAAWAILPVAAAWANVHGAFVIGGVLVGAEAAGEFYAGLRDREGGEASLARGKRLLAVAVLFPLAACLNPHGWRQVTHPFLYMIHPEIHAGTAEWERPDLVHLPLLLLTAAAAVTGLVARGSARPALVLRVAAFGALFLTGIRHLPLLAFLLVPAAIETLGDASARGGWRRHLLPTSPRWGTPAARLIAFAMLAVAVVGLSGAKFVSVAPRIEERMTRPMPERAVRFVARERVEGIAFNGYRFGGFLMYRLYPEERVFMDGRNDLYGTFRADVYDRIQFAGPGWKEIWDDAATRYDVGFVLLDEDASLVEMLKSDPSWLQAAGGGFPVTDGTPGRDGIVLALRDTPANRERLPRLLELCRSAR